MTWFKVDENAAQHPKLLTAGEGAVCLWMAGGCWTNKYLTNGFIPEGALRHLSWYSEDRAERLTRVGLWDRVDGGVQMHDFLDYNIGAEDVKKRRADVRTRVTRHRSESSSNAPREPIAPCNGNVTHDVTRYTGIGHGLKEDLRTRDPDPESKKRSVSATTTDEPVSMGSRITCAGDALEALLSAAGAFFHGEQSGTSPIKLGKKGLGMGGLQMGEQERQWCEAWKSAGQSYGLEDLRRLGEAIKSKAVYKARPPSIGEVCRKLPDLLAEALAWNGGTADTEVEEYPYKPFDTEAARRRYLGQE